MSKVIYEKHPITPERKAELVAAGYKIIDAKFAPADEKPAEKKKAPVKRTTKKAPAKAADDKAEGAE